MTPNDTFCSGDTTVLIKAVRSLPGWYADALPPTPSGWGACLSLPCGCEEGRAERVCAVWGRSNLRSPALAWGGLGSLTQGALMPSLRPGAVEKLRPSNKIEVLSGNRGACSLFLPHMLVSKVAPRMPCCL